MWFRSPQALVVPSLRSGQCLWASKSHRHPQANSEAENLHETANKSNPFSTRRRQAMDETPQFFSTTTDYIPHITTYSIRTSIQQNKLPCTTTNTGLEDIRYTRSGQKEWTTSKRKSRLIRRREHKQNKLSLRFNPNIRFNLKGTIITASKSKYITRTETFHILIWLRMQESDTTCWRVKWWRVRHRWHRAIRSATKCSSPQGPLTLKRSTRIP